MGEYEQGPDVQKAAAKLELENMEARLRKDQAIMEAVDNYKKAE